MQPARTDAESGAPRRAPVPGHLNGRRSTTEGDGRMADSDPLWSVEDAEQVLRKLRGVISARVVLEEQGEVEEIHLLTGTDVPPKKTVRRVESAFMKNWGVRIDHRKVSVAQSRWPVGDKGQKAKSSASFLREPTSLVADRPHLQPDGPRTELRFDGHQVELEPSGRMRVRVFLESGGEAFTGEATGSQRARSRMTMLATATLNAVRASTEASPTRVGTMPFMSLEDVDVVDAFKRDFVLAAVTLAGSDGVTSSAGAAPVEASLDRAVILSTLKAVDPWVRD